MCVIFLAYKQHPKFPLIVLANRDEFYERPTASAHYWNDAPHVLAGKDLLHGGTWLGVSKTGRFAAVTNFRDPTAPTGSLSRGNLVGDFLKGNAAIEDYLQNLKQTAAEYSGYNLLVGELNGQTNRVAYFSNKTSEMKFLEQGIYGLSNHLLDTAWYKIVRGKSEFKKLVQSENPEKETFFELLKDKIQADDVDLPDTGIGFEREKLLSPIFIETPIYGTRCSTLLMFDERNEIFFEERNFH